MRPVLLFIPLQIGFDIGGIVEAIISGLQNVFQQITEAIKGIVDDLLSGLTDLVTSTPYPDGSGGGDDQPLIFNPSDAEGTWEDIHNYHQDTIIPIAIVMFLLAFLLGYAGKLLEDIPEIDISPDLGRIFFLFLFAIAWWSIMAGSLALADGIGQFLVNSSPGAGGFSICSSGGEACDTSSGNWGSLLLTFGIMLFNATAIAIGVLFWIIRLIMVYLLSAVMPLFIAMMAFDEVNFPYLGDLGRQGYKWFWFVAFANVPAALVYLAGGIVTSAVSSVGFGNSTFESIAQLFIEAAIPIVALYYPMLYLVNNTQQGQVIKNTATGAAGAAATGGAAAIAGAGAVQEGKSKGEALEDVGDTLRDRGGVAGDIVDKKRERSFQGRQLVRQAQGREALDLAEEEGFDAAEEVTEDDSYAERMGAAGVVGGAVGSASETVTGGDMQEVETYGDESFDEALNRGYNPDDFSSIRSEFRPEDMTQEEIQGVREKYGTDASALLQLEKEEDVDRFRAEEMQELVNEREDIDSLEDIVDNREELLLDDDVNLGERDIDSLEDFLERDQIMTESNADESNFDNSDIREVIRENRRVDSASDLITRDAERLAGNTDNLSESDVSAIQDDLLENQARAIDENEARDINEQVFNEVMEDRKDTGGAYVGMDEISEGSAYEIIDMNTDDDADLDREEIENASRLGRLGEYIEDNGIEFNSDEISIEKNEDGETNVRIDYSEDSQIRNDLEENSNIDIVTEVTGSAGGKNAFDESEIAELFSEFESMDEIAEKGDVQAMVEKVESIDSEERAKAIKELAREHSDKDFQTNPYTETTSEGPRIRGGELEAVKEMVFDYVDPEDIDGSPDDMTSRELANALGVDESDLEYGDEEFLEVLINKSNRDIEVEVDEETKAEIEREDEQEKIENWF